MKPNLWQHMFGAKRRASDKKLLAALEREIADEEKLRASPAYQAKVRKMTAAQADAMPVHQISEEQRKRIAAAFGRPI